MDGFVVAFVQCAAKKSATTTEICMHLVFACKYAHTKCKRKEREGEREGGRDKERENERALD